MPCVCVVSARTRPIRVRRLMVEVQQVVYITISTCCEDAYTRSTCGTLTMVTTTTTWGAAALQPLLKHRSRPSLAFAGAGRLPPLRNTQKRRGFHVRGWLRDAHNISRPHRLVARKEMQQCKGQECQDKADDVLRHDERVLDRQRVRAPDDAGNTQSKHSDSTLPRYTPRYMLCRTTAGKAPYQVSALARLNPHGISLASRLLTMLACRVTAPGKRWQCGESHVESGPVKCPPPFLRHHQHTMLSSEADDESSDVKVDTTPSALGKYQDGSKCPITM